LPSNRSICSSTKKFPSFFIKHSKKLCKKNHSKKIKNRNSKFAAPLM
jgi:hypothetical protein